MVWRRPRLAAKRPSDGDVCLFMQEREAGGFKAEVDEEFEDADGNVYNKRTYEDLRRQGLI